MYNVDEYRTAAVALLRELNRESKAVRLRAAKRLKVVDESDQPAELNQALTVIACEAGFGTWAELEAASTNAPVVFDTKRLFAPRTDLFLNLWFSNYKEALDVLRSEPAQFLFPHAAQFVLCDANFLQWIGVDASDEDWTRIGHDWHQPADLDAKARLALKLDLALRLT